MAYSDNYPNGYKSGYSSADDYDRKDYSPMGVEGARRDAMAASMERDRRMSEYNAGLEREKERQRKIQQKYEMEEAQKQRERQIESENREMYITAVKYLCQQKRDEYKKKSWFSRAVATLSGKGYYKIPFWDLAQKEVSQMSEEELNDFYNKRVK